MWHQHESSAGEINNFIKFSYACYFPTSRNLYFSIQLIHKPFPKTWNTMQLVPVPAGETCFPNLGFFFLEFFISCVCGVGGIRERERERERKRDPNLMATCRTHFQTDPERLRAHTREKQRERGRREREREIEWNRKEYRRRETHIQSCIHEYIHQNEERIWVFGVVWKWDVKR